MRMTFTLILVALTLGAAAQKDTSKPIIVTGTELQWKALYQVMQNSNDPHAKVEALKNWLLPQIQKQLADTTGKK
jgi:hypothetical protein